MRDGACDTFQMGLHELILSLSLFAFRSNEKEKKNCWVSIIYLLQIAGNRVDNRQSCPLNNSIQFILFGRASAS